MENLYKKIIKNNYSKLPITIQKLHSFKKEVTYKGKVDVKRGNGLLCSFIAWLISLPTSGDNQNLSVTFKKQKNKEYWYRTFNDNKFNTVQWEKNGLLYERSGIITHVFDILTDEESLSLDVKNVLLLGIPVYWLFKPKLKAVETEKDGVFQLDIVVALPFFGTLVEYKGWLK